MKRAALAAAAVASAIALPLAFGSSHREAPNIALDPTADNTDVYAFTADDAPGALTVVANWIPFEDPAGGPNFYRFDDRARYYINIDNTGDGRTDIRYKFRFRTNFRNLNTFLKAAPQVESLADDDLFELQTYSVTKQVYDGYGRKTSSETIGRDLPVAPSNIGPKTMPNYDALADEAIQGLRRGGKVFAGQRDDPFFVDLGATFDGINLRRATGNEGGGKDDLAGYNTHAVVLQVPESEVTRNREAVENAEAKNAVVGVWASTERTRLQVTSTDVTTHSEHRGKDGSVQVSRLGNPLVNEVVIPRGEKDKFNRTQPENDAENFGAFVVEPEAARLLNALFGLGVKEEGRTDIVTALLTGVPGLTQIGSEPAAADTLKINLGVPPSTTPNRFGVLANDVAGFPNGRRLEDDVVDIELRVIGGFLVPEDQGGKKLPLGDGVDRNDKDFLSSFPYLAAPTSGFDASLKRIEPTHAPTPGQP